MFVVVFVIIQAVGEREGMYMVNSDGIAVEPEEGTVCMGVFPLIWDQPGCG